ncbi:hypothetical protein NDU88_006300, partial [Pleurodeles waltl]
PRKILKILRNAVKLDDGKVWNVRQLSVCRREETCVESERDEKYLDECNG